MKPPFIVGLDVDGVLADFMGATRALLRAPHNATFAQLCDLCGGDEAGVWERIAATGPAFHATLLSSIPGAIEGVKALLANPLLDVRVVTSQPKASRNCAWWCNDRTEWLVKVFGVEEDKISYMRDKSSFGGDILVDDTPEQLAAFRGRAVLFTQPWNADKRMLWQYTRAQDWVHVPTAIVAELAR